MTHPAFPLRSLRTMLHGLFLLGVITASTLAFAAGQTDYMAKFAKARQLAEQGHDAAASKIYEALIKQDPLEPQAYNNLAAIRARHGQLKQAQALLEKALRSNPVYATVYENLSEIYVEMARDTYGKALHLGTPQKQVVLRELTQPSQPPLHLAEQSAAAKPIKATKVEKPAKKKPVVQASKAAKSANTAKTVVAATPSAQPATVSPETVASASPAAKAPATRVKPNAGKPPQKTPAAPTQAVASTPQPAATSPVHVASATSDTASMTPATTDATQDKTADAGKHTLLGPPNASAEAAQAQPAKVHAEGKKFEQQEVVTTLQGWAAAWSGKAVERYLSFYTPDYAPRGMTHAQWAALRRQRLLAPKWIHVSLNDFKVGPVQGNTIRVRLVQKYEANNYHDLTRKAFRLRHTADGWRIFEEKTLAKLH